ncbi:MAG: BBE domain-containing protein, partial [Marmoricola sp.]
GEWLDPLDDSGIDAFVSIAEAATSPLSQTLLRVTGGVMSRIPEDATAFRHRGAASMATVVAMWPDPSDPGEPHKCWTRDALARLQPWSAGGGYVNHLGDEGAGRVRQAYGPNWKRLVELKRRVDPTNVFALNQNISPA